MKANLSVVVVYDDAASREQAVQVCEHLIARFWADRDLDLGWWSCAQMGELVASSEALDKASRADLIVFALQPDGDLPATLQNWIEECVSLRGDREGLLLHLSGDSKESESASGRHVFLRHAAHRGGMDYLTHEPQTLSWSQPDSPDSITARAESVTRVLDEILHAQPAPPRL